MARKALMAISPRFATSTLRTGVERSVLDRLGRLTEAAPGSGGWRAGFLAAAGRRAGFVAAGGLPGGLGGPVSWRRPGGGPLSRRGLLISAGPLISLCHEPKSDPPGTEQAWTTPRSRSRRTIEELKQYERI